ncbi:unnamed protein product [Rotaria magnacalcarata]
MRSAAAKLVKNAAKRYTFRLHPGIVTPKRVLNHNIYTSMPSSNQRSTSTTNRPFIIVLTNNSALMRHICAFQFPVNYNNFFLQIAHQRHTIHSVQNGANNNDDILEQLLNNLLGLELRDEALDYLSWTS